MKVDNFPHGPVLLIAADTCSWGGELAEAMAQQGLPFSWVNRLDAVPGMMTRDHRIASLVIAADSFGYADRRLITSVPPHVLSVICVTPEPPTETMKQFYRTTSVGHICWPAAGCALVDAIRRVAMKRQN